MIGWVLALLGVIYWSAVLIAGALTVSRLVRVDVAAAALPEGPAPPARISIIVAARDEVSTIRHGAEVLAAFDHPDVELVLVDDRSTDGTGEAMDHAASLDDRITALHVTELPPGWLGKVHALEHGRRHATGEWLLFTDADVELAPELPAALVRFAEHHRLDALALLPEVSSDSTLVAGVVATFSRWLTLGAQLWRATDPERPEAFGVGACNLVRASALERAGGFSWIRLDVADDAALAQMIAAGGGRTMIASGVGLVRVRWQSSVTGMTRGFEKYGGSGGVGSIPAALAGATVATVGELAPWGALALTAIEANEAAFGVAAATVLTSAVVSLELARRSGAALRGVVALPVGAALVWWMQVRAAWLEHRRGGVVWRDTFYSTEALRAAKRYRLPGLGWRRPPTAQR